jgi:hypothetical protein
MDDNYEEDKVVCSDMGMKGFISVIEDHWLTNLLEDGKLLKNTSCSIIEFNFSNSKNENMENK